MTLPSQQKENLVNFRPNELVDSVYKITASTWEAATQAERERVRAFMPSFKYVPAKGQMELEDYYERSGFNSALIQVLAALDSESSGV